MENIYLDAAASLNGGISLLSREYAARPAGRMVCPGGFGRFKYSLKTAGRCDEVPA